MQMHISMVGGACDLFSTTYARVIFSNVYIYNHWKR